VAAGAVRGIARKKKIIFFAAVSSVGAGAKVGHF